jgi:hypothetical protein
VNWTQALLAVPSTQAAHSTWYNGLIAWLARAGQILAALVAAGAVLGFAWGVYRRTLGRRRDRYGRLARLGTNGQISFFAAVLGEPPAMRRVEESLFRYYAMTDNQFKSKQKKWIECIWIDRDFYVHVVADEDETIHAYSVTTRTKRFRPDFRQPGGRSVERGRVGKFLRLRRRIKLNPKVKLGKTHFQVLGWPAQAAVWTGAHNRHYFEAHRGGNPGFYQTFVYSINDAGYNAWEFAWDGRLNGFWRGFLVDDQHSSTGDPMRLPPWYEDFRRKAHINTYTVLGPELQLENYPFFELPSGGYPTIFGPNDGRTRTLAYQQKA